MRANDDDDNITLMTTTSRQHITFKSFDIARAPPTNSPHDIAIDFALRTTKMFFFFELLVLFPIALIKICNNVLMNYLETIDALSPALHASISCLTASCVRDACLLVCLFVFFKKKNN